ncbi:MAG: hypothetical protein HOP33_15275 [Verrucomicrobia bacterium]|nr:hypothetical protein [Verrucomicrobiota bacterium]
MSTPAEKSDFLLLFRDTIWDQALTPDQLRKVLDDWRVWFERLVAEGKCRGGLPLLTSGKVVSGRNGRTVADGPFAESKENIGGYFHLQVADEAEAVRIAQQCPGLEYGCVVEVRPVGERITRRLGANPQLEQLAKSVTSS